MRQFMVMTFIACMVIPPALAIAAFFEFLLAGTTYTLKAFPITFFVAIAVAVMALEVVDAIDEDTSPNTPPRNTTKSTSTARAQASTRRVPYGRSRYRF